MNYVGQELDLFAHARNWKAYWSGFVRPFIQGDVLEAGAGLGVNTALLQTPRVRSWTCLEPDESLADRCRSACQSGLTAPCKIIVGTTQSLDPVDAFDTVLYIDVLEHIERDSEEVDRAARLLRTNGHLIVLSPAHQWLFSPFDKAIGHFRRYNRNSLKTFAPPSLELKKMVHLDSAGMLLSMGNRLLLRQSTPALKQIRFWDQWILPISRVLDPAVFHRAGRSILGIWQKRAKPVV